MLNQVGQFTNVSALGATRTAPLRTTNNRKSRTTTTTTGSTTTPTSCSTAGTRQTYGGSNVRRNPVSG